MSEIEEIAKQVLALDEQREPSNVCFAVCRTAAPQLAKAVIEQAAEIERMTSLLERENSNGEAMCGACGCPTPSELATELQKQLADCRASLQLACDLAQRKIDEIEMEDPHCYDFTAERAAVDALRKAGGL